MSQPKKGMAGLDAALPKFGDPDWRPGQGARPMGVPVEKRQDQEIDLNHREAIIFENLPTAPPAPVGPVGRMKNFLTKKMKAVHRPNITLPSLPKINHPSLPNMTILHGSSDTDLPKFGDPDWRPWHGARPMGKPGEERQDQEIDLNHREAIIFENLPTAPPAPVGPVGRMKNFLTKKMKAVHRPNITLPSLPKINHPSLPNMTILHGSSDTDLPKFGDPDWRPWHGARPMGKPGEERNVQEMGGHKNAAQLSNGTEAFESNVVVVEGETKTQESYAGLPTPWTFENDGQSRGRTIADSGTQSHEVFRIGPSISDGLKNTKATKHGNGLWNLVGLAAFIGAFGLTAYVTRDQDEKAKPDVHPSFFEKGPESDVEAWAKHWDEHAPDDKTATTGASEHFDDGLPPTERLSNRSFGTTNEAFEDEIFDEEQRPSDNRTIYSKDDQEQQQSYYEESEEDNASYFVNKPPPSIGRNESYASRDGNDNGSLYETKPSAVSSYPASADDDASFHNSKQTSMKSFSKHSGSESSKPSSYPFTDDDQSAFGQQSFVSKGDGRFYQDASSKADQQSYYSKRSFSSRSYVEIRHAIPLLRRRRSILLQRSLEGTKEVNEMSSIHIYIIH